MSAAARVWALEEVKTKENFGDLAVAFKRVVNIIKKFGARNNLNPERLFKDEEKMLFSSVVDVERQAEALIRSDDYTALMERIVGLKPAIDYFFDHVLVDDPDADLKANRLALLTRVVKLFELVADFSIIST